MNVLLWVLQILLAFWNVTGGIYTLFNYEQLKGPWAANVPAPVWVALCVLQALFGVALILPATKKLPRLTPLAAVYLAVNALLGCVLFAQYAGFPGLLWGVIPACLALFVAYGRMARK
jgi:hypothetical protein